MLTTIKKPYLFNPLKHHLGYILEFIKCYGDKTSSLRKDLSIIGSSQIDLYCGCLSIDHLLKEFDHYLNNCISIDKDSYIELINESNDYLVVALSDGSEWFLRVGTESDRYVHFHPARFSPQTLRITANALKSLISAGIISDKAISLEAINRARVAILGLDPIQDLDTNHGIGQFVSLFTKK